MEQKKDIGKIEAVVDRLPNRIPGRVIHKKKSFRTNRVVRFLTTPLIGLVLVGVAGAVLCGMFTSFYGVTSGDIALHGQTQIPLFFMDDQEFTGRWFNDSVDITDLYAGDEVISPHVLRCDDGGNWSVFWSDPTASFKDNELDPYYGFYYSVTDENGIPFASPPVIHPGESLVFNRVYSLDREFMPVEDPLYFECTMSILPVALLGVDDTYNVVGGQHYEFAPWENDVAFMTRNVVIDSFTWDGAYHMTIEISSNHRFLLVDPYEGGSLDASLTLNLRDTLTGDVSSSHCLIHFA